MCWTRSQGSREHECAQLIVVSIFVSNEHVGTLSRLKQACFSEVGILGGEVSWSEHKRLSHCSGASSFFLTWFGCLK